jgi:hypothetical protein
MGVVGHVIESVSILESEAPLNCDRRPRLIILCDNSFCIMLTSKSDVKEAFQVINVIMVGLSRKSPKKRANMPVLSVYDQQLSVRRKLDTV